MPARRTVTVLFCDVVDSTALAEQVDAEAVWPILSGYFDTMRPIIERHGGVVEKFIGDAIMAIFGLTAAREDDALRAVRAATEMRAALAVFNEKLKAESGVQVETRMGINTGEVLVPDRGGPTLATGDAVNVAARLEQAAGPGDVLLGETTYQLVKNAVDVEALEATAAKGKSSLLHPARLISLRSSPATSLRDADALVGRGPELASLLDAWRAVEDSGSPRLVSVIGAAGVGKSRLVHEFANSLGSSAQVVRGRCLSYGEGLTYWPIREIAFALATVTEADGAADVVRKLEALLKDARDGSAIAATLANSFGAGGTALPEEINWAVRRLVEYVAGRGRLVVVVEDVHWAQPPLLDLLEHIRDEASGQIMIVCPARPEFAEQRPDWRFHARSSSVVLEGLPTEASGALLDRTAGPRTLEPALRERVLAAAEGNPLFLEEIVRLIVEHGDSGIDFEIPLTIQALMAARIDQLSEDERSVAQRGAVIGRVFEQPAVVALSSGSSAEFVDRQLDLLVHRELLTAEAATAIAFKFRHILLRDAAYQALPKSERADLHVAFADWLEATVGDRIAEYDELIGYHLAESYRYRNELRARPDTIEVLGQRAGLHLDRAAGAAMYRGDMSAAVALLERVVSLPPVSAQAAARILVRLADALQVSGQAEAAMARVREAIALATDCGDRGAAALAQLTQIEIHEQQGHIANPSPEMHAAIDEALANARSAGDALAIARALASRSLTVHLEGRLEASREDMLEALDYARQAGDERQVLDMELGLLVNELVGLTPASLVADHALAVAERTANAPYSRADSLRVLAIAEAMLGRPDSARASYAEGIRILRELHQPINESIQLSDASWVERILGDFPAAERHLHAGLALVGKSDRTSQYLLLTRLVVVLTAQGRYEEAERLIVEIGEPPQMAAQARLLGATARIHAVRGETGAIREVDRLMAMADRTGLVNVQLDILVDAAEVMAVLGRVGEATRCLDDAIEICDAKEHLSLAAQLRARRAEVLATT
jgi:class 3 adenylate cyclase/tetratricopeptide (TPR) repeat protein